MMFFKVGRMLRTALLLVFVLASCGADPVLPKATVSCRFGLLSENIMSGFLTLEQLNLDLGSIGATGQRDNGGTLNYSKEFAPQAASLDLFAGGGSGIPIEVTEGTYPTFELNFSLLPGQATFPENQDSPTTGLGAYLSTARTGIVFVGRYVNGSTSFPVVLLVGSDLGKVTMASLSPVMLSEGVNTRAFITFDLSTWFSEITTQAMEGAAKFPLGAEQAVVISSTANSSLYTLIKTHLLTSATVEVENP